MNKIKWYTLIGVVIGACLLSSFIDNTPNKASSEYKQRPAQTAQKTETKKDDEIYKGIVQARSLWVENKRNLYDYEDGFRSGDKEFLLQQVREGKAFFVENPTFVVCKGAYKQGKIIQITFVEGRFRNKRGYVFADFVQKLDK